MYLPISNLYITVNNNKFFSVAMNNCPHKKEKKGEYLKIEITKYMKMQKREKYYWRERRKPISNLIYS